MPGGWAARWRSRRTCGPPPCSGPWPSIAGGPCAPEMNATTVSFAVSTPGQQAELRGQCTVFLTGHGPVSAAGLLASIPPDTAVDRYGDGGVVTELEAEVGELLGKTAAAVLPS